MSPIKRLVSFSIATGLAFFSVVDSRTTSQQAVLAQDAAFPQQSQLIAQKQSKIALVIGNAAYDVKDALTNPVNDAKDIAKALEDLGFEVTLKIDLNKRDMEEAIESFKRKLDKGSVGVFYYAGHGVQFQGENYLIPLNAEISMEQDLNDRAVRLRNVIGAMKTAGNQVNIAIIDACRDNPFYRQWNRSRSIQLNGLTTSSPPRGIIIAYATQAGAVAKDGWGQRNSPFTSALLENIKRPNEDVQLMFRRVSELVHQKTGGTQEPWTEGNLRGGEFPLNPKPATEFFSDGRKKYEGRDFIGAIPDFNEAIRLKFDYAEAYYYRGQSFQILGENKKALDDFQGAARLFQQQQNTEFYAKAQEIITKLQPPKSATIEPPPVPVKLENPSQVATKTTQTTSLFTLKGHSSIVNSVAFSPDGKHIVSGGSDGIIKVWDFATGQLERSIKSTYPIKAIIAQDGQIITLDEGYDENIKVWNQTTGEKKYIRKLSYGVYPPIRISSDGQRLAFFNYYNDIHVFNFATEQIEATLRNVNNRSVFRFSSDGKHIIISGEDTIKVWNIATGQIEKILRINQKTRFLANSPDFQRIIVLSDNRTIEVWNIGMGQIEKTFGKNNYGEYTISTISPNGQHLLIGEGGFKNTIAEVWNIATGQLERSFKDFPSYPRKRDIAPFFSLFQMDRKLLLSTGEQFKSGM